MDHRFVSPIENYSVARHNLDFYRSITFYLTYAHKQRENQLDEGAAKFNRWKSSIERALRLTIASQCRLTLQVDQSRKDPWFIRLSDDILHELPIEFLQRSNENSLRNILEKEVNSRFNYNRSSLLWRVNILYDLEEDQFDLIVSFNHAIADGISGMAFLQTFHQFFTEQSSRSYSLNEDQPSYQLIPSTLPPISSLISSIFEKLLLPQCLTRYFFPKTYWVGDRRSSTDHSTRLVSFHLSKTQLKSFHEQCRNERTTITSALLSAVLLSIMKIYADGTSMEFLCNVATNLRPYCEAKISNEQMGVFVSAVKTCHYLPWKENMNELFWPLSRQIKDEVHERNPRESFQLIQSLKFVSNWEKFLRDEYKILPNGYQSSAEISNVLCWSMNDHCSWKILDGGFTQSSNVIGSPLTISVVTINDQCRMIFSFDEETLRKFDEIFCEFAQTLSVICALNVTD